MKNLFLLLFTLALLASCRVTSRSYTPGYDYSYDTRSVVNVPPPSPIIINPYLYRPAPIWYNPYRWSYFNTPRYVPPVRPRTNIIINNYNPPRVNTGPRGGRRK